jgi:hypothetical protein
MHTCSPSAWNIEVCELEASLSYIERPCLKQNKTKQNKKLKSTLTLKLSLTSLFHSSFKFNMAAKFIGSTFHDTAKV